MKALVTGANGFLGTALVKKLVDDGHEVYALVRKGSHCEGLSEINCHFVYGDITDFDSLRIAFQGMDAIFHLAGVIAYKKSDRPLMDKVNVQGTQNVIDACSMLKMKRLVYISSVVAVGASVTANEILSEASVYNLQKQNFGYFETKRIAEERVIHACKEGKIDAVILNPSTIYGEGDAKKGSRSTQVKVARGKFKFYTPGGVSVVALEDVVQGIISAWKSGRTGERYILSGENITIKKLFELIAIEANVSPPRILMPRFILIFLGYLGDFMNFVGIKSSLSSENAQIACLFHWFDSKKAQTELDFHPRSAREAIHKSVQWMKDQHII